MKTRSTILAGFLSGAVLLLAGAPAMARTDVSLSIGVPGYYYSQPEPVYYEPQPVYVQQRQIYVQPQPYYIEQQYRQDWRQRRWYRDHRSRHDEDYGYRSNRYDRDRDNDGVPNRFDRDRDGDGVPNRFDRRPNNPYRN
jgi:hypothetical protein